MEGESLSLVSTICMSVLTSGQRTLPVFLLGHPFDLLKTRMQAQSEGVRGYSAAAHFRAVYARSGLFGLYLGWRVNLLRMVLKDSYRVVVRGWAENVLWRSAFPDTLERERGDLRRVATGLTMALSDTLLLAPLERLKVWLMTMPQTREARGGSVRQYMDMVYGGAGEGAGGEYAPRQIHANAAMHRVAAMDLFRGLHVALLRSAVSWCSFLVAEGNIWDRMQHRGHLSIETDRPHLTFLFDAIAAGLAGGAVNCAATMPLDAVKTRMQMHGIERGSKQRIMETMRLLYREQGMRALYAGWEVRLPHYVLIGMLTSGVLRQVDELWRTYTESQTNEERK